MTTPGKYSGDMLKATQNGLRQIEGKKYVQALSLENSDVKRVFCYGLAFCKKECLMRQNVRSIAPKS